MAEDTDALNAAGSRDELVARRDDVEGKLRALCDAADGESPSPQISELEVELHKLNELIDRIDIAVEIERQSDA